MEIPKGLCQCGCGGKTKTATITSARRGWIKGEPLRFIKNHHQRKSPVEAYGRTVNPSGRCLCGCGGLTPLAKKTDMRQGTIKGEPQKFISGHQFKGKYGENHSQWRGGRRNAEGYVLILKPDHPRADNAGYVREHILIAEKALGKPLPPKAVVHHTNGTRNSGPLVICQDPAYHRLLHIRLRALKLCGHVSWRQCHFCHKWDNPINMLITKHGSSYHRSCRNSYDRARYGERGTK